MSRTYIAAGTLIVLVAAQACTGYRDMKNEIKAYQPPSYLPAQEWSGTDQAESQIDTTFKAEKKQMAETRQRWEKALTSADEKTLFYRPDSTILASLRPAVSDDSKATAALQSGFSPQTLEALTLLRNPGIEAAANRFRAAVEKFSQVANLDEILRRYTAFTEGLMTGIGPMKGRDPVQMKFPFPGVLSLKGEIVGQEARAAWEGLEMARREAITAARKAYWNFVFVRRALKIEADTVELFRRLESVANTRYEGGKTSFQDVIKVRIQREILVEELTTLREKQRNMESKVREIVNLPPGSKVGSPVNHRPSTNVPALASLYPLAHERRQELRQMRAKVGKMERMIEMAETMVLPPYTLNFSLYDDEAVNQVGSAAMKETFPTVTTASRGAGLPKMPWYGTNDAFLRETRQKLKALKAELIKMEAATKTLVRNSWFDLDQAKREEALYRQTVVKLSQAALEVSTRGYETGQVTFADVIASYNTWLQANLTLARKKSDLGIARAELERVVGTSLR
jgi:outer membrane protein TolC